MYTNLFAVLQSRPAFFREWISLSSGRKWAIKQNKNCSSYQYGHTKDESESLCKDVRFLVKSVEQEMELTVSTQALEIPEFDSPGPLLSIISSVSEGKPSA